MKSKQLYIYVFIRPTTSHPRDANRPGNAEQIDLLRQVLHALRDSSLQLRVVMELIPAQIWLTFFIVAQK